MSPADRLSAFSCYDPTGLLPQSEAERIAWLEATAERCEFTEPGDYWLALDLADGEIILLPNKEYLRQVRQGAQFDRLSPITLLAKSQVEREQAFLRKLREGGAPPN